MKLDNDGNIFETMFDDINDETSIFVGRSELY